jgi:hypothetical protein
MLMGRSYHTVLLLLLFILCGELVHSLRRPCSIPRTFPSSLQKYVAPLHRLKRHAINPDQPTPEINPSRRDPDESQPQIPVRLPTVEFKGTQLDVNSRLLQDRIIMIGDEVNDEMANVVVAQLLYLNKESPTSPITMYINSPGGSISSGMAIFDTMKYISCNVSTVCFGMAASMGAFLLGSYRYMRCFACFYL